MGKKNSSSLLAIKVNLFQLVILLALTGVLVYFGTRYTLEKKADLLASYSNSPVSSDSGCKYDVKRVQGYKYIKPILFVDQECEGSTLQFIKSDLINYIDECKSKGEINSVAVYLKDYQSNDYFSINGHEKFMPASLMKVPFLITFLKMSEKNPGLLQEKYTFNKDFSKTKTPEVLAKSIEQGKSYTVEELLQYMIQYSDNNATYLLSEHIDNAMLNAVFTDFGLQAPQLGSVNLFMSAEEYSRFMRSLVNGTYLTKANSEKAIALLTTSVFDKGIQHDLPKDISIAHKFGESGNENEMQLHESGIVYLENKPYLITVMTKGSNKTHLEQVIQRISSKVYQSLKS